MNFTTKRTCDACPEQYDVFDENNKAVGYLRLRWGIFTADKLGENTEAMGYYHEVYRHTYPDDPMLGLFPNEEERQHHIRQALNAIEKELADEACRFNSSTTKG